MYIIFGLYLLFYETPYLWKLPLVKNVFRERSELTMQISSMSGVKLALNLKQQVLILRQKPEFTL